MSRLHRGRKQLRGGLLADVARERGFNRGGGTDEVPGDSVVSTEQEVSR